MPIISPRKALDLIARLKRDPSDDQGPSRTEMLRERAEAAEMIQSLLQQLGDAQSACDKAMSCMQRWESGKPYNATGPEAAIKKALYDVIRPGAREGIKKLGAWISRGAGQA